MEHRLILGGEQYLPFARSCVTKLKKLGLPYAGQSYEINGTSIKVRVEPGHEYIRIEGGYPIQMDSGAVSIGSFVITPYAKCYLKYYGADVTYNAAFTRPVTRSEIIVGNDVVWHTNPQKDSAGQLAGDLSVNGSEIKGVLPPTGKEARSFALHRTWKDEAWVEDAIDDTLLAKKHTALNCPASIFTGKCRMFVQAVYGRHLYAGEKANYSPSAVPSSGTGTSPYLSFKSFIEGGANVSVSTSSGVFLDAATLKHWLICFDGGGESITFYPLVGEYESLRPQLNALKNETDRERLEAYILSTCLPDTTKKQVVKVNNLPHAYSLGYGWHWDWSNGNADIVNISSKEKYDGKVEGATTVSGVYYTNTSTHYRLTVTPTNTYVEGVVITTWAAKLSVITPEIEWNLYRSYWCVLEPNWPEGGFLKTTLRASAVRAVINSVKAAPLYAFYIRDEMHLLEVHIQVSFPGPDEEEMDPPGVKTTDFVPAGTYEYNTLGLRGGHYKRKGGGSNNVDKGRIITVSFSCGKYSTPDVHYNKSERGIEAFISEKTIVEYVPWQDGLRGQSLTQQQETFFYDYGYPAEQDYYTAPATGYQRAFGTPGGGLVTGNYAAVRYTVTTSDIADYYYGTITIVCPRDDAQALFIRSEPVHIHVESFKYERLFESGRYVHWGLLVPREIEYFTGYNANFTNPYMSERWVYRYTVGPGCLEQYKWGQSGNQISITSLPDSIEVSSHPVSTLVANKIMDVYFPFMYEATNDNIENVSGYTFSSLSGLPLTEATVFAPGRDGLSEPVNPVLVGYI